MPTSCASLSTSSGPIICRAISVASHSVKLRHQPAIRRMKAGYRSMLMEMDIVLSSRRQGARLVLLGKPDHRPRHRIDPGQVIVHALHARHIFGGDDESAALPLVGDHAPEAHHTIAHHYIDLRRPRLLRAFRHDL